MDNKLRNQLTKKLSSLLEIFAKKSSQAAPGRIIQVGQDPSSAVYIRHKMAAKVVAYPVYITILMHNLGQKLLI